MSDVGRSSSPSRTPVVFIPGLTGSGLRHRATGRVVWGRLRDFLLPYDRGRSILRPLEPAIEDPLEATTTLARVGPRPLAIDAYGPLIRGLQGHGYSLGSLRSPGPRDDLFPFAYNWRQSHLDAVALLAEQLEAVRRVRGLDVLPVHLICHSNGGTIGRWLARFGGEPPDAVRSGADVTRRRLRVEKLILVGSASGGAVRTFQELLYGTTYLPKLGRRFAPEVLFSFPSLLEAIPAPREDLFIDERGNPLSVDHLDPESWQRNRWSVYAEPCARTPELDKHRDAYLERALATSRQLHELLESDASRLSDPQICVIHSTSRETQERVVLTERAGRWKARFATDRFVRRSPLLRARTTAAGDGYASESSRRHLSARERAALARPALHVDAEHRSLLAHPHALAQIFRDLGLADATGCVDRGS